LSIDTTANGILTAEHGTVISNYLEFMSSDGGERIVMFRDNSAQFTVPITKIDGYLTAYGAATH
jgi:hypothetical protein